MADTVRCVVDCKNILGEVPLWDGREQALYWVDIEGKLLQRLKPASGQVERWVMPERIASFALRETGGLVVAFASGIAFLELPSLTVTWIARPEADKPGNRFNEGKVDRRGRFWAGTMDDSLAAHTAALYRLDPDRKVSTVLEGVGISNCFVWSREDDRFWFADSLDRKIYSFDYDSRLGSLSNRRLFADTAAMGCTPDGGTIDAEGFIYVTDRVSDMVVSGGVNLYPSESEQALRQAPGVADVAVIGIPHRDLGEQLLALVVASDASNPPAAADLQDFCRELISSYKIPRVYEFVAELPRNEMQKVDKKALRKPYWASDRTIAG